MIVVVAGVAGSGKTTVGQLLARRLGWLFADGDSFHPAANVAKMRAGLPLDGCRPRAVAGGDHCLDGRHHRQRPVRGARLLGPEAPVPGRAAGRAATRRRWCSSSSARRRTRRALHARTGHFFHEPLLASQFADLEMPSDEPRVHLITVGNRHAGQVATEVIKLLGAAPGSPPQP